MNLQTDVCIVGGGPAGAFLGYILAQNGISTVIIERATLTGRKFRGEHINAETESLLKNYGLFEKIAEQGILKMEKVEFFNGNQVVKTITPTSDQGHVGIHVPQSHLLNALVSESEQYKHYHFLLNTTVTELLRDEKGCYIGVKAKKDGKEIIVNSSVIVGADGRYSTVRKLANIPVSITKHGYDVLWTKIPAPQGWEPTTRMALVNGHQLALFTQAGGFIQIGWNIDEGSFSSLTKNPLKPFLEPILESFPQLREIALQHLQSWKDFVCLKVESSRSETWVQDGLVMIGDAAHTMTPTGAIGINSAMKDAHVLANVLVNAILGKNTTAERLKEFEELRRDEIEKQQEQQITQETSFWKNYLQAPSDQLAATC